MSYVKLALEYGQLGLEWLEYVFVDGESGEVDFLRVAAALLTTGVVLSTIAIMRTPKPVSTDKPKKHKADKSKQTQPQTNQHQKQANGSGSGAGAGAGAGGSGKSLSSLVKASKSKSKRRTAHAPTHPSFSRLIRGHSDEITSFAYSLDGRYVATCDTNGLVRVVFRESLGTSGGTAFHRIEVPRDYPTAVAFTPDSKYIVLTTSLGKQVMIYELHSKVKNRPELKSTFDTEAATEVSLARCAAFHLLPSSTFIITMGSERDTTLNFYSPRGRRLGRVTTSQLENYDFAMDPKGKFLSVATWQPEAKIWHVSNKSGGFDKVTKVMSLRGHSKKVTGVQFSADSERAFTCSADGTWKEWNINVRFEVSEDPRLLRSFDGPGPLSHLIVNADSTVLGMMCEGNLLFVDVASGDQIGSLPVGQQGSVSRVEFLPDGKSVAVQYARQTALHEWHVPEAGAPGK